MESKAKLQVNKKTNPLDEAIDAILKTQAKSCVRAKKLLEKRQEKANNDH